MLTWTLFQFSLDLLRWIKTIYRPCWVFEKIQGVTELKNVYLRWLHWLPGTSWPGWQTCDLKNDRQDTQITTSYNTARTQIFSSFLHCNLTFCTKLWTNDRTAEQKNRSGPGFLLWTTEPNWNRGGRITATIVGVIDNTNSIDAEQTLNVWHGCVWQTSLVGLVQGQPQKAWKPVQYWSKPLNRAGKAYETM